MSRPLPPEIDSIARGYWASRVLLTAIELDLFTALGEGAKAAEAAARAALAPGGLVVISDFILDENRATPAFASLFGINMLVGTGGGDSCAESDYWAWFAAAGFGQVQRLALPGPAQLVVGRRD